MKAYESLSDKHKLFVQKYCTNSFIGWKAYQETYPDTSKEAAYVSATRLLQNDNIKKAMSEFLTKDIDKDKLQDQVLGIYIKRATYNPNDIVDEEGMLKKNIPEDIKCCIDGIERMTRKNGEVDIIIKLADKDKSLAQLAKYTKMITDKIELSGELTVNQTKIIVNGEEVK